MMSDRKRKFLPSPNSSESDSAPPQKRGRFELEKGVVEKKRSREVRESEAVLPEKRKKKSGKTAKLKLERGSTSAPINYDKRKRNGSEPRSIETNSSKKRDSKMGKKFTMDEESSTSAGRKRKREEEVPKQKAKRTRTSLSQTTSRKIKFKFNSKKSPGDVVKKSRKSKEKTKPKRQSKSGDEKETSITETPVPKRKVPHKPTKVLKSVLKKSLPATIQNQEGNLGDGNGESSKSLTKKLSKISPPNSLSDDSEEKKSSDLRYSRNSLEVHKKNYKKRLNKRKKNETPVRKDAGSNSSSNDQEALASTSKKKQKRSNKNQVNKQFDKKSKKSHRSSISGDEKEAGSNEKEDVIVEEQPEKPSRSKFDEIGNIFDSLL